MSEISPFNKSGEYLTFLFHHEDEEHLVPRALFAKSHKIEHLVDYNNQVAITNIASSTFFSLTTYLSGNHQELTADKVEELIAAAKSLGLLETVKELMHYKSPNL